MQGILVLKWPINLFMELMSWSIGRIDVYHAYIKVAMYTFLEELTGSTAGSDEEKALACQAAEHQYAG